MRPLAVELLTQATLRQRVVFDVQELVALPKESHIARFESAPQPFASVERDLNMVREPGLQSHVHPAVLLMIEIQVQMLALGRVAPQLGKALLGTVVGPIRPARFQARPHADQARIDARLLLGSRGQKSEVNGQKRGLTSDLRPLTSGLSALTSVSVCACIHFL